MTQRCRLRRRMPRLHGLIWKRGIGSAITTTFTTSAVRRSHTPEGSTPTPTPSGTPAKKPKQPGHKHKKKGKAKKSLFGNYLAPAHSLQYSYSHRVFGAFV